MHIRYTTLIGTIPVIAAAAAVAASAAPLAVYTVTLAAFGLPHVLSELRYVDRRFGSRVGSAQRARILSILGAVVCVRAATVFHLVPPLPGVALELSGVALLALSVAAGQPVQRGLAVAVAIAIGAATLASPYETSVTFAILHNLTPLGFLWQLAPSEKRRVTVGIAAIGCLGLPLLVASGATREAAAALGWISSADPMAAGPLVAQLGVYVPRALIESPHVVDFFSASATAQCVHYFSVLFVLPLLLAKLDPAAEGLLPWPKGRAFVVGLVAAGAAALLVFAMRNFADGRALYGIAASFHAWLEIPVLILALTSLSQDRRSARPAANEAALATSETSIAR